jgi:hypothetical protein
MDPFSVEVLYGFIESVTITIVITVFVERFIIVHAPIIVVARPGGSIFIDVFLREECFDFNFFCEFVVPVRFRDFKFFIPFEIFN